MADLKNFNPAERNQRLQFPEPIQVRWMRSPTDVEVFRCRGWCISCDVLDESVRRFGNGYSLVNNHSDEPYGDERVALHFIKAKGCVHTDIAQLTLDLLVLEDPQLL